MRRRAGQLEEEWWDGLCQLPVRGLGGERQPEPALDAANQIILYLSA